VLGSREVHAKVAGALAVIAPSTHNLHETHMNVLDCEVLARGRADLRSDTLAVCRLTEMFRNQNLRDMSFRVNQSPGPAARHGLYWSL
jgi:hypothetical protein